MELMKDKNGDSVFVNDYIMFGVPSSGMSQIGEMRCERVVDKTGHGIGVTNYPSRFKVSHKIVKVSEEFALQFQAYNKRR